MFCSLATGRISGRQDIGKGKNDGKTGKKAGIMKKTFPGNWPETKKAQESTKGNIAIGMRIRFSNRLSNPDQEIHARNCFFHANKKRCKPSHPKILSFRQEI